MKDLSVIIPASNKNGVFINKTIESILANMRGNTDIIVVYNGAWPDPGVPSHELVTFVHYSEKIGQRAAVNVGAKLSKSKYLMKLDAHCSLDEGFDVKMMADMQDDWTFIPMMKNLHAFDWVCPNGHRRYQGPTAPCAECGQDMTRDMLWIAKDSPKSVSFCFDSTPHFQYFGEFSKRPEGQGDITESMSIQGSCFMVTRDKYFELNLCDENFGSWGSQGIEVACKTWLSGGKVMVNKKTWYAHMFRTQGGDFGFSHHISQEQVDYAKSYARDMFFNGKWPLQKKPLSWLVEKFWPVKGWTEEDLAKLKNNTFQFAEKAAKLETDEIEATEETKAATPPTTPVIQSSPTMSSTTTPVPQKPVQSTPAVPPVVTPKIESEAKVEGPTKGIIFYTDNQLNLKIAHAVQNRLQVIGREMHIPIVSSSLKRMTFGDKNIYFPSLKRGHLTMFKQILGALENSTADIIFFCEHDVLYHASHFDFVPPRKTVYYYNTNVWKVLAKNGRAIWTDNTQQLSGLCAYREFLIRHYKKLVAKIEKEGFSRKIGFEPGTHNRAERIDDYKAESWMSIFPNIDIRHDHNLTETKISPTQFRNKKFAKGWKTSKEVPGWGVTQGRFDELLK